VKGFDSFLITLDNWLDGTTNYFLDRQMNGFQDGFNSKIKSLKRSVMKSQTFCVCFNVSG